MDIFGQNKHKKKRRRRRKKTPGTINAGLDIFGETKHSRGTKRLIEVFSPLLLLFEVKPSGNLFKDFGVLSDKISDEQYFLQRIFNKIFDQYDTNSDGVVDESELRELLKDVGAAVGDPKLENISASRLEKIRKKIDTNNNGLIERDELVDYLVQWVDNEEDFCPVAAIPPYRGDDSYYPMSSSEGSIGALSDMMRIERGEDHSSEEIRSEEPLKPNVVLLKEPKEEDHNGVRRRHVERSVILNDKARDVSSDDDDLKRMIGSVSQEVERDEKGKYDATEGSIRPLKEMDFENEDNYNDEGILQEDFSSNEFYEESENDV